MQSRYFLPNEIEVYFSRGLLPADLSSGSCLAVCSIADIVELCEKLRKGTFKARTTSLTMEFARIESDDLANDSIFIANLEREDLEDSLFEPDGSLWLDAAQHSIPPMHSVRRITLRPRDTKWWTEDVYAQMEAFHTTSLGDT